MESLNSFQLKNYNDRGNYYISPGNVGTVGDVLQQSYLRSSSSDIPLRNQFSNANIVGKGANIQNGTDPSYQSGGLGAETVIKDFSSQKYVRYETGFRYQDLRPGAVTSSERLLGRPMENWKNSVALTMNSKTTGDMFLPSGGILYEGVPRGPAPTTTVISGADFNIIQPPPPGLGYNPVLGRPGPVLPPIKQEPAGTMTGNCPNNNCGGPNIESTFNQRLYG